MDSRQPRPFFSWCTSSILKFLIISILYSPNETHSQYFDVGQSQSLPSALKGEECYLNSTWEGNWFQSGFHQPISINRSIISTKGQCIENDGDKFLFFNSVTQCWKCVVFHKKHENVLQYKETFCYERGSLRSICSTIQSDYNLYTMFRLDALPIECPFHGQYMVSYNRGYGECSTPSSSLDSCMYSSKIVLNYQACPDIRGTESSVEEIECLATWKDGSSRYLLGFITYNFPASYEERFRCFVYEKVNKFRSSLLPGRSSQNTNGSSTKDYEIIRVAQSADATCLGLSPNEGSKTLVLKNVNQNEPCTFPSWLLKHTQWLTLSQNMIYNFEEHKLRISNYSSHDRHNNAGDSLLVTQALCTQIIQHESASTIQASTTAQDTFRDKNNTTGAANRSENLTDKITLVLHSTSECQIGYICMTIYKREGHIVEFQSGKLSRTIENACHPLNFDPEQTPFITLTSSTPESRECPFLTNFDITTLSIDSDQSRSNCHNNDNNGVKNDYESSSSVTNVNNDDNFIGTFAMGCNNIDLIELQSNANINCVNDKISEKYRCLGWWEEASGENYLVVSSSSVANSSHNSKNAKRNHSHQQHQHHHHYKEEEERFCFVFYETGQLSPLSQPRGERNQEIISRSNRNDNDDQENDEDDDGEDDENSLSQQQQAEREEQLKNLKRQFHFVRFSQSCDRTTNRQQQQQQRLAHSNTHENVLDNENSDQGGNLVFSATTSFYENSCHVASSRKSFGTGSDSSVSTRVSYSSKTNLLILFSVLLLIF